MFVPVPQTVILAHGRDHRGTRWYWRGSTPAQGGIPLLGSAAVDKAVDVPVTTAVRANREWLCLAFSSLTECWTFQLCHRDRFAQCQTVQKTGDSIAQFLGMLLTHPSLCNDWCRVVSRQCQNRGGAAVALCRQPSTLLLWRGGAAVAVYRQP